MTIVAEHYAHAVGVDMHARTHTYALLSSVTGQVADTATFPTSPPGIGRAIKWIANRTTGTAVLVSIEGASSYGGGLSRALLSAGIDACDVRSPCRASRTGNGKSDAIDAVAAIIHFTTGMEENQSGLAEFVAVMAPGLLDVYGVGPVTASTNTVTGSWTVPWTLSPRPA